MRLQIWLPALLLGFLVVLGIMRDCHTDSNERSSDPIGYGELDMLLVDATSELDQDVTRSLKVPPVKLLYGRVGALLDRDELLWIELEGYRCKLSALTIVETVDIDASARTAALTFKNCEKRNINE